MRRALCAAGLASLVGCGWTLPEPDVRRDARLADGARDASRDATLVDAAARDNPGTVMDLPIVPDTPAVVDVPTVLDLGLDAGRPDVGEDTRPADALADRPVTADLGPGDAPVDRGAVPDVSGGADVTADSGEVQCVPGDRRSCYQGPPASRGRGYCRDGVETCDPGGHWGGPCVNSVVPDCADRRCGTDDCGGTCGSPCVAGQVCDDVGRCVVPSCGMGNFTEMCTNGALCPSNSNCTADDLCACRPGFVGRTCAGVDCGTSCTFPNWYCARASFCGAGAIACPGGFTCPRHATCGEGGRCVCAVGFVAVTCAGDRCTSCPGTDYRCVPVT